MNTPVFERIDQIMREKKHQNKELLDYLHLGPCTYDNWKNQRSSSYLKYMNEIAKFLGVTPNYLMSGEKEEEFSFDEGALVKLYRTLSEKRKIALTVFLKAWIPETNPVQQPSAGNDTDGVIK